MSAPSGFPIVVMAEWLSCGVNDTVIEEGKLRISPDESCDNVRKILGGAQKYKVIMVGPPPVDSDEQNARIEALSAAFSREAQVLGIPYIDLFSPLASDDAYLHEVSVNDGAHPRSGGYSKMAKVISSSAEWWFKTPL